MRLAVNKDSVMAKRVTFRMTDSERKHLDNLSDKFGMTPSDILRGLVEDEYNKVYGIKKKNWRKI